MLSMSTSEVYLHAVLYHCNGALPVNLVWAWQDLATAERILERCFLKNNILLNLLFQWREYFNIFSNWYFWNSLFHLQPVFKCLLSSG